jgi:hypothetical protein
LHGDIIMTIIRMIERIHHVFRLNCSRSSGPLSASSSFIFSHTLVPFVSVFAKAPPFQVAMAVHFRCRKVCSYFGAVAL